MNAATLDRLTVQVTSVLWRGDTATALGCVTARRESLRVVAKGRGFAPVVGDVFDIDGHWLTSAKHGRQFYADASTFRRRLPEGRLVVPWLQRVEGIGPSRAKRVAAAFGADLNEAFKDDLSIERLAHAIDPERPNLAMRVAARLAVEWRDIFGEYETLAWLERRGVADVATALRVARLFGPSGVTMLDRNPYLLATVLPWPKVDALARSVLRDRVGDAGLDLCSERIVGAIDVVMQAAVAEGHTALPKAGFADRVASVLATSCSSGFARRIEAIGLANGAMVDGGHTWRVPGCAIMEEDLTERFRRMAASGEACRVKVPADVDLRRLLAMVERRGAALHDEQRSAVAAILRRPLACLAGGAGTGKTTTCRAIVDLWEALGGHVQMAALAGKAALRLAEGTGRIGPGRNPPLTIHRLLLGLRKRAEGRTHWGPQPEDGEKDVANELPRLTDGTLLLVDEASMVDLGQMHELVDAMPRGCRLLLVGDPHQLPPIGFGLVFQQLVGDAAVTSTLEVVRRQEGSTGIPAVAGSIRAGAVPRIPDYWPGTPGVSFLEAPNGGVSETIERVSQDLVGSTVSPEELMVVAAVNRRPTRPDGTVREINARFHRANRDRRGGDLVPGYFGNEFAVGDPVTFLRNDYDLDLRNGSLGRVTAIDTDAGTLVCDFGGRSLAFGDRDLVDLALAYAVTCHRAQGSQARSVIVSCVEAMNLDRSWLYTAVTRAVERVVVVGQRDVFERALSRPPAHSRRRTGPVTAYVGDPSVEAGGGYPHPCRSGEDRG